MHWIGCISASYGTTVRPCLSHLYGSSIQARTDLLALSVSKPTINSMSSNASTGTWSATSGIGRNTYAVALIPPPGCGGAAAVRELVVLLLQ